jgi:hypothetical protein
LGADYYGIFSFGRPSLEGPMNLKTFGDADMSKCHIMVILRPLADYKAKTRLKSFKQISMLIITLCKETIAYPPLPKSIYALH